MLGISIRLNLDNTDRAYLEELLFQLNTVSRRAYQRVIEDKMSVHTIRQFAVNEGLTNHQANSVVFQVNEWIAVDKANRKKH